MPFFRTRARAGPSYTRAAFARDDRENGILKRWLCVLAGMVAGLIAGLLIAGAGWIDLSPSWAAKLSRFETIRRHARQIEQGQLLVIGDSTAEGERLTSLCGLGVLDAGVNGALIRDVTGISREAIATSRPSVVAFTIGLNDLQVEPDAPRTTREQAYRTLLDLWPGRPVIVGLTPMPGVPPVLINQTNVFLAAEAARRNGVFVPPLEVSLTEDGVHAGPAGAREWQHRIDLACKRVRGLDS